LDHLIQAGSDAQWQDSSKGGTLPELPLQYADFALWQRQVYSKAVITKQLAYWQQQLVPKGSISPAVTSTDITPADKSAHHYFTDFPPSLASAIGTWRQMQGGTGFALLLAGLNLALAEWSGQSEILVVATVGNRTPPETEQMIGCFINDVILRSRLSASATGSAFIQQIQTTVNEAIDHKEVPLQQVIEQTKRHRSLNLLASLTVTPSIQAAEKTLPNWAPVDLQAQSTQWDGVPTELYTIGTTETTPLEIYAEISTTVRFVVSYSPEHFSRSAVENLFTRYQTLLTSLIAHPERVLSTYSAALSALADDTG
jgi:non-ribosomal peptide synthetase component F